MTIVVKTVKYRIPSRRKFAGQIAKETPTYVYIQYIYTRETVKEKYFSFSVQCLRSVFCMGEKVCPQNLTFDLKYVTQNSTCGQLCVE